MKYRIRILVWVLVFLVFSLTFNGIRAETPPDRAYGTYHLIEMMQGDNPDTTETESTNLMTVIDTMLYHIPYNVSKVYIHVPEGGTLTSFRDDNGIYNDSIVGLSEYQNSLCTRPSQVLTRSWTKSENRRTG